MQGVQLNIGAQPQTAYKRWQTIALSLNEGPFTGHFWRLNQKAEPRNNQGDWPRAEPRGLDLGPTARLTWGRQLGRPVWRFRYKHASFTLSAPGMIHPLEGRQHFGRVYIKARLRDACTGARKEAHTQDTVARLKGAELALFLAPQAIRPMHCETRRKTAALLNGVNTRQSMTASKPTETPKRGTFDLRA